MKRTVLLLLAVMVLSGCFIHKHRDEFYDSDLAWKMKIPATFVDVNEHKWKKVQQRGRHAIEDTYNTSLPNKVNTLFIFKGGDGNFFEATSELYNYEKNGDYAACIQRTYGMVYHSLLTQRPDVHADTTKRTEQIAGLDFYCIEIKVTYPNRTTTHSVIYSRLFDTQNLTVSIMYADEAKGKLMREAFRGSRFGRR